MQQRYARSVLLVLALQVLSMHGRGEAFSGGDNTATEKYEHASMVETCGVACAYALGRYYNLRFPISDVVARAPKEILTRPGITLGEFLALLRSCSLRGTIVAAPFHEGVEGPISRGYAVVVPSPGKNHLFGYFSSKGAKLLEFDAPYHVSWVDRAQVERRYEGVSIIVAPESWPPREWVSPSRNGRVRTLGYLAVGGFILCVLCAAWFETRRYIRRTQQ